MRKQKQVKIANFPKKKKMVVATTFEETLSGYPAFRFDYIDRTGTFAFDTNRADFDHKELLDKLIDYSRMKWTELARQTHDSGKSKHHYLKDLSRLSREARYRLEALHLEDFADELFSFALNNTLRLIGIRQGDDFHILWYDKCHEVYPSRKKHT